MTTGRQTPLRVVGLFAGIGGIEIGLSKAGHDSVLLCELEPAAQRVLKKRLPSVPLHADVTDLAELPDAEVVSAGFPCQDLSQAGRTAGIKGSQSSLVDHVFRLIDSASPSPTWLLLENVSFMLSLDKGRAMTWLTERLDERGFTWAYRVVDSRAFGLPQRRQRVLLLASSLKTRDRGYSARTQVSRRSMTEKVSPAASTGPRASGVSDGPLMPCRRSRAARRSASPHHRRFGSRGHRGSSRRIYATPSAFKASRQIGPPRPTSSLGGARPTDGSSSETPLAFRSPGGSVNGWARTSATTTRETARWPVELGGHGPHGGIRASVTPSTFRCGRFRTLDHISMTFSGTKRGSFRQGRRPASSNAPLLAPSVSRRT